MQIIIVIMSIILCLISFWVMVKDKEAQILKLENDCVDKQKLYSKDMMIYSVVIIGVTIGIAVLLGGKIYETERMVFAIIKQLVLLCILWPLAYIDFTTYRIPNSFIILGLLYRGIILGGELLVQNQYAGLVLLSEVIAAAALFIAAIFCTLIVKNSLGYGDIKLFIVMGLMLGMQYVWSAIFMSLVVSFFVASYVLMTKKKKRNDAIPFAPAIVIGTYISIILMGM